MIPLGILKGSSKTNWALNTNGGSVTASQGTVSFGSTSTILQGNRGYANGEFASKVVGYSNPSSLNVIIEVTFAGSKKIDTVFLFSNYRASTVDSPLNPSETDLGETFFATSWGIEYTNGLGWINLNNPDDGEPQFPNNKIWGKIEFNEITATKIRVHTYGAYFNTLYLIGIEAWGK